MMGLAEMAWQLACFNTLRHVDASYARPVERQDLDKYTYLSNEYYRIIDFIEREMWLSALYRMNGHDPSPETFTP
jgi:hypothetical protein